MGSSVLRSLACLSCMSLYLVSSIWCVTNGHGSETNIWGDSGETSATMFNDLRDPELDDTAGLNFSEHTRSENFSTPLDPIVELEKIRLDEQSKPSDYCKEQIFDKLGLVKEMTNQPNFADLLEKQIHDSSKYISDTIIANEKYLADNCIKYFQDSVKSLMSDREQLQKNINSLHILFVNILSADSRLDWELKKIECVLKGNHKKLENLKSSAPEWYWWLSNAHSSLNHDPFLEKLEFSNLSDEQMQKLIDKYFGLACGRNGVGYAPLKEKLELVLKLAKTVDLKSIKINLRGDEDNILDWAAHMEICKLSLNLTAIDFISMLKDQAKPWEGGANRNSETWTSGPD